MDRILCLASCVLSGIFCDLDICYPVYSSFGFLDTYGVMVESLYLLRLSDQIITLNYRSRYLFLSLSRRLGGIKSIIRLRGADSLSLAGKISCSRGWLTTTNVIFSISSRVTLDGSSTRDTPLDRRHIFAGSKKRVESSFREILVLQTLWHLPVLTSGILRIAVTDSRQQKIPDPHTFQLSTESLIPISFITHCIRDNVESTLIIDGTVGKRDDSDDPDIHGIENLAIMTYHGNDQECLSPSPRHDAIHRDDSLAPGEQRDLSHISEEVDPSRSAESASSEGPDDRASLRRQLGALSTPERNALIGEVAESRRNSSVSDSLTCRVNHRSTLCNQRAARLANRTAGETNTDKESQHLGTYGSWGHTTQIIQSDLHCRRPGPASTLTHESHMLPQHVPLQSSPKLGQFQSAPPIYPTCITSCSVYLISQARPGPHRGPNVCHIQNRKVLDTDHASLQSVSDRKADHTLYTSLKPLNAKNTYRDHSHNRPTHTPCTSASPDHRQDDVHTGNRK
eukprot:gene174-biopygen90